MRLTSKHGEAQKELIRKQLREISNELLKVVKEEVDSCVLLCDTERLDRLVSTVHVHMDSEVIRGLRQKGLSKEIRELCDKAGRIKEVPSRE